jgi:hypothetical protein
MRPLVVGPFLDGSDALPPAIVISLSRASPQVAQDRGGVGVTVPVPAMSLETTPPLARLVNADGRFPER